MKKLIIFLNQFKGITVAIIRYPITIIFLSFATLINIYSIYTEHSYTKEILSCVIGAFICSCMQVAFERFFTKVQMRIILGFFGIILSLSYYLIIRQSPTLSLEIGIRTAIAMLALFFLFIWIPVIRSRITFNESFMVLFKAFFHSLLYAGVLFIGIALILSAIDLLILSISEKVYMYAASVVFILVAPVFLFSFIPYYPGKNEDYLNELEKKDKDFIISKAISCPKILEVLLSYIIIPLVSVFTIILVIYISTTIKKEFWTNNLLEPLLVSYVITVILVYILTSTLKNKMTNYYHIIFPKLVVPIVLFQIIASVLSLQNTGITHTRYFVIIFGLYAMLIGILLCFLPIQKNGIIAVILVIFCMFSIIPPMDAFTVSRVDQTKRLELTLQKNNMLNNNKIVVKETLSDEDKRVIASTVEYLSRMKYINKITWMPENFEISEDFKKTFGFDQFDVVKDSNKSIYIFMNNTVPINIDGYDVLLQSYVNSDEINNTLIHNVELEGRTFSIVKRRSNHEDYIELKNDKNQEVISFNTREIFERYQNMVIQKAEITQEEATFFVENENAKMKIIVLDANIDSAFEQNFNYCSFYILLSIK